MPVATAPSLPDLTTPPVGSLDINTPAQTVAPTAAGADGTQSPPPASNTNTNNTNGNNTNGNASTTVGGADRSEKGGVALTPGERERQIKLGLLLVRLGAAKENHVFGARGLTVPPRDLLVIHRPEDDAQMRRPFRWYNPISWFLSGPRPSPLRWSTTAGTITTSPKPNITTTGTTTTTTTTTAAAAAAEAAAEAASMAKLKRKTRPLPTVRMEQLKDDTVLESAVREDREKLISAGKALHSTLDSIEETRYAYLVPSYELECEDEVLSVVKCYEKYNTAAHNQRLEKTKTADASSSSSSLTLSMELPVEADVLQCGPVVALLRKCAEGMVAAYSEANGDK
ncbi:hypothetical protein LSM04_004906 [Trypanosoma melophagium]|uniref:uncharacterized protein n=1 Tax=Trypanosoma melophagium TaxID=715481 RepID=UPI00351A5193|nr:hypothetical protein LSM04_004906 [Trypanosoma melophagium]